MPHRPHQLNLAGALTHKGETYLPDFIRTGPPRWNRLYALTEDGGENKIKIKMAGRELYYIPTTYWDFEKSSLKNWLSDTLIESKELAFKMLRVKTGFNIGDEDLPTLVDAPLELIDDKASDNQENQDEHKVDTDNEDQILDDEVTSFVPNKKRPRQPPKKRKRDASSRPPPTWSSSNHRGGRYFNRQVANEVGYFIDTRGRRPSPAGRPGQRSYRGQHGGLRSQRPYQGRRPYRGRYRGGPQPGSNAPAQPPAQPPANPPTVPQTTQAPFVPWPFPMMGCQGHSQFSNSSPLLSPLLNMLLPR
jgi:hypothetical protein